MNDCQSLGRRGARLPLDAGRLFFVVYFSGDEEDLFHAYAGCGVLALVAFRIVRGFVGTKHARFADFVYGPHGDPVLRESIASLEASSEAAEDASDSVRVPESHSRFPLHGATRRSRRNGSSGPFSCGYRSYKKTRLLCMNRGL
jgi:hypothetical protein